MSKAIGLAIMAGGVALAVVIGQRLSTDAMAVVIGVAVGVFACIPTSLLVMAAMRRGQPGYERPASPPARPDWAYQPPAQPQIYIVNPGQAPVQQGQLMPPGAEWPAGQQMVDQAAQAYRVWE